MRLKANGKRSCHDYGKSCKRLGPLRCAVRLVRSHTHTAFHRDKNKRKYGQNHWNSSDADLRKPVKEHRVRALHGVHRIDWSKPKKGVLKSINAAACPRLMQENSPRARDVVTTKQQTAFLTKRIR